MILWFTMVIKLNRKLSEAAVCNHAIMKYVYELLNKRYKISILENPKSKNVKSKVIKVIEFNVSPDKKEEIMENM